MTATATVTLYELAEARDILDEMLAETEGEVTPELEQLLTELAGQIDEKVERVALYIREQLATAAAIREEEQRLAARRKARERAAEGLKSYLLRNLQALGKAQVKGLLCTVAVQNNPPRVQCELSDAALAEGFARGYEWIVEIPATHRLDAKLLLEYHKAGRTLPNGVTVEQGQHLRIR